MKNRRFLGGIILFLLGAGILGEALPAFADDYPSKPLTYTIFFPPGGRSDIVARMLAPTIEKYLKTPVIVTNNTGGVGVIGHKAVKEAKNDGYTVAQSGTTIMFQYTKPGIKYTDYAFLANLYSTPFVVAVPGTSPYKSLKELIDYGKANPKKLRHGNTGTGSTTHLGSSAFSMRLMGNEFTQIAYKGEGPATIGIAAGEVEVSLGPMVAYRQMFEANKIRVLAVLDDRRLKQFPQFQTAKELGYPFSWGAWEAIFAPKSIEENKPVYAKLTEALSKALQDPELDQKMSTQGLEMHYKSPAEMKSWLAENDKEIKKIIFDLGLQYK
jgi:tripartite-type tricarboxylate transporter receptor subunit TctC